MAINPILKLGGVFQAPPVAPVRGLATQGPGAAARATGTVPPIPLSMRGVNIPAIEVPTGLASLTGGMQRQNQAATATSDLVGSMQDEIEGTDNIDQLLPKMLGAGIATKTAALEGTGYETGGALADSGEFGQQVMEAKTISDDGSPAPAATDTAGTVPGMPVIPDNITKEQAKTIAMETMGLTGEEDYEDANTALMMFGLGLMATPGPLGQAIGIAGQKAMPQILQAQRAKRARRKDVGVMAYNIREKRRAERVSARAALAKRLAGNQKLSLDIMKEINSASAKTLDSIPEYLRGVVAMEMGNPSYNNILGYVRSGNIGGAFSGAQNATQLAISKLRRKGIIKEGELKGFPDRGWQKFLEYGPAGSANENMVRTSIVALNEVGGIDADPEGRWKRGGLGEKRAISSWGPKAGTDQQSMLLTNDGKGNIVLIQNTGPDAARKTGLAIERTEAKEIQGQEREVVGLVSKADQVLAEVGRVRELGLSAPTRPLGKAAAVVSGYLGAFGFEKASKAVRDGFSGLYKNITKLSKDDHGISRKPEAGIWLGNQQRTSRAGVTGYLNKLDVEGAKGIIAAAEGDTTTQFRTDDEKAAFLKFAAAPAKVRALLYDMAYTVARAAEPGGRLTDRDVANALMQLGYNENGFVSADIFREVLTQKVNNEVDRHSQLKRQLYLSGLTPEERRKEIANPKNSYNFPEQYGYIAEKPPPAWLGRPAAAPQQQAAPVVQEQTSQFPDFPNALVSAPLQLGPNRTTTLAQFSPEFSPHYFTKTGELKDEDSVLRDYGIPEKGPDGKTLQGGARLDEFEKLLMRKYGYTKKKAREELKREIGALTEIMQNTKKLGLAPQLRDASKTYLQSWQSP